MSTQFVDRKIHNFVEEKKNWEEQLPKYWMKHPNIDVTGG